MTLKFTSDSVKRAASQFLDEEPADQPPVYGVTVQAAEEEVDICICSLRDKKWLLCFQEIRRLVRD